MQFINTSGLATRAISNDHQDKLSLVEISFPGYEKKIQSDWRLTVIDISKVPSVQAVSTMPTKTKPRFHFPCLAEALREWRVNV